MQEDVSTHINQLYLFLLHKPTMLSQSTLLISSIFSSFIIIKHIPMSSAPIQMIFLAGCTVKMAKLLLHFFVTLKVLK